MQVPDPREAQWSIAQGPIALARGRIDVWAVPLVARPSTLAVFSAWLSPDELERAERFRFARHRTAYIIAHGALRSLLALYLKRTPPSLRFARASSGKPAVAGTDHDLAFNMAHAADLALYGFAEGQPIGIDVENRRAIPDAMSIAARYFAPAERAALAAAASELRSDGFLRCWTRKEALLKALGRGLSHPLDGCSVLPLDVPTVRVSTGPESGVATNWRIHDVAPDAEHVGAVAAPEGNWTVRRLAARDGDTLLELVRSCR